MAVMYSTWPPTHLSYDIMIFSDQFMLHLEDILAGKISLQFREDTLSLLVLLVHCCHHSRHHYMYHQPALPWIVMFTEPDRSAAQNVPFFLGIFPGK